MFNAKKCFAAFFAGAYTLTAVNAFAASGSKVLFDEDYSKSIVSEIPKGSVSIVIEPEKESVNVGETFLVDFKIKNNSGFSSYGFKVEYDGTVVEPVLGSSEQSAVEYSYNSKVRNKAVENESIKTAVKNKKENYFTTTGFCMSGSGKLAGTEGDGSLFTVEFKAVGKGDSKIDLSGHSDFIFSDADGKKMPVYVENAIVSVAGKTTKVSSSRKKTNSGKVLTTETESISETETESVSETESVTETETEGVSEDLEFSLNVPTKTSQPVEFRDMAAYPWAKDSVNFLSSLGVVKGIGWRTFKPAEFTTRADFLIIVKRFTGIEGKAENVFEDVDIKAYYAEAVGVITKYGLATGVTDTKFMPKENVTRQEVIAILARVLEKAGKLQKSDVKILDKFIDEDFVSPYAREYMADLIGMGIVSGNDKNKLRPVEPITRAEVCVLVKKVYDVIK